MKFKYLLAATLATVSASAFAVIPAGFTGNSAPTSWTLLDVTDPGDGSNTGYASYYGAITFDDWGYRGPTPTGDPGDRVTREDYQVGPGFDGGSVGQIQKVTTLGPDWLTPDAPSGSVKHVDANFTEGDFGVNDAGYFTGTPILGANMDGGVNFYHWPYSSPPGSVFSSMLIDTAGNYFVDRADMNFAFYGEFDYNTGPTDGSGPALITPIDTGINFQPYPISDGSGWCGSTMASDPNGVTQMAGQLSFDFAIDVFYGDADYSQPFKPQTEIIPAFSMTSYGDYVVDFTNQAGDRQYFTGSAVGNNFNPTNGYIDPAYKNRVSFLGAGIIPTGVWVLNDDPSPLPPGYDRDAPMADIVVVDACRGNSQADGCTVAGATWHQNAFQGKAFLFRAEGERLLEFYAIDGHSDYVETAASVIGDDDVDGWIEVADNCTSAGNSGQQDTDSDNYGNACDADFNDDGNVNSLDIGLFKTMMMATGDQAADHNSDGIVNSLDIGLFKAMFMQPPGPSGLTP